MALGDFLRELPSETQIFVFAIGLMALIMHAWFTAKVASYGPTILTTTGIFATFVGIALGLSHFNPDNIQASVPTLLAGLKTAFWASVMGVGCALTLKLRDLLLGHRRQTDNGHADEVTAEDLARSLRDIHRGLVGSEDGSLISQVKLSRQDANDRLDRLHDAQSKALAQLSEMGSKALVEALKDVIRDFNSKISEQFGENFKELNRAVGALLVWQEQYQATIESTVEQLQEVVRLSAKSTADYAQIVEHSAAFSKTAQELGIAIGDFDLKQQNMITTSEALAKLLLEASGSLPQIENKVMELTTRMTEAVSTNQRTVSATLTDGAEQLRNTMQTVQQNLASAQSEYSRQMTDMAGKTKDQVAVLDAALSEELRKSLESLGRQLTALSERFVADYQPLTDRLRRIVEMARV